MKMTFEERCLDLVRPLLSKGQDTSEWLAMCFLLSFLAVLRHSGSSQ